MLRQRLRHGLSTLVILLLGVGCAGLLLLRNASLEFDTKLKQCYSMVDVVQRFPVLTATISRAYLVPLSNTEVTSIPDRRRYDEVMLDIRKRVEVLQNAKDGRAADEAVDRLSEIVSDYSVAYEEFFSRPPATEVERGMVIQKISGLNQRIADISESIRGLYQEQLFTTTDNLTAKSSQSILFIVSLMILGIVIAILIYFHLAREIVDPVVSLSYSIEELKRGNFEFSLPTPRSDNELSALIPSFNEMALELRQHRREMDERLLRTNLQNRAVLTAIPAPVFLLNEDASIDQLNPAAESLQTRLGVSGRLPGSLLSLFHDCVENHRDYLPDDIREAALFRIEDEEFYFLPRIFRFSAESGDGAWWAVLLMDVTRFRWLDEMKTNLLATVSHEIKTPLTGIRMVLHLLLEGRTGDLNEMQQNMVTSARDDCERLLVTLKRLLDLARVENGASQLQLRPVNLVESLERARRLFSGTAEQKGCRVVIETHGSPTEIIGDSVRLDEVIHNLLSNALKHSPPGNPVILRLSRRPCGRFLRISVIDHGEGVPEDSRGKLFDKFFRVPGQKTDGVGLGLSIAREIVLAHSGRIGMAETVDGATEFVVDLPITPADEAAA
jgi:two-component system, NtrC family, sensor histidine kinase KinB